MNIKICSKSGGFSFYEVLIVVALLAVISFMGIPEIMKARVRAKAANETENLRLIESAKAQYARANPGTAIGNVTQLLPYLPGNKIPTSPWNAKYENVTSLTSAVTSSANGDTSKEPKVLPLNANGFNDLGNSGLVYMKASTPGGFARIGDVTPGSGFGTGATGAGTGAFPATGVPPGITGSDTGDGTGDGTTGDGTTGDGTTGDGTIGDETGGGTTGSGTTTGDNVGDLQLTTEGRYLATGKLANVRILGGGSYKKAGPVPLQLQARPANTTFVGWYLQVGSGPTLHYRKLAVPFRYTYVLSEDSTVVAMLTTNSGPGTGADTGAPVDPYSISLDLEALDIKTGRQVGAQLSGAGLYMRTGPVGVNVLSVPKYYRFVGWYQEHGKAAAPPVGMAMPSVLIKAEHAPGEGGAGTVNMVYDQISGQEATQYSLTGHSVLVAMFEQMNRPPTVTMTADPLTVTRNEIANFIALGHDPDGDQMTYRYAPDGGYWSPVTDQLVHNLAFATLGLHQLAVRVYDPSGASGSASASVDVIRNLMFYWNETAAPASIYSINTTGVGDPSVVSLLRNVDQSALSAALMQYGSTRKDWTVQEGVIEGAITTLDQVSSWAVQDMHEAVWHREYWDHGRKKHDVLDQQGYRITTTYTNYYHEVYTPYSQLTNFYAESAGGGIVMFDQDTGEILGAKPASQWSSLVKGVDLGSGADRGRVNSKFAAQGLAHTTTTANWKAVHSQSSYTVSSSSTEMLGWDPLTVSFGKDPDFLAGGWRAGERIPVLSAMREVDLDGTGPKMWEWLGPQEGLLVYNPGGDAQLKITGDVLFGNGAFGQKWRDGFAALATLDKDGDGNLTGPELDGVWVWRDAQSDAQVQDGEFVPAKSAGISSIGVVGFDDGKGGLASDGGVKLGNKTLAIRDWWSLGGMSKADYQSFLQDVLSTPAVYSWEPVRDEKNPEAGKGIKGGLLRFVPSDLTRDKVEGIIGLSVVPNRANPEAVAAAGFEGRNVSAALSFLVRCLPDEALGWNVNLGDSLLMTRCRPDGDTIAGTSGLVHNLEGGKHSPVDSPYQWVAKRSSGPQLAVLLDAYVASKQASARR